MSALKVSEIPQESMSAASDISLKVMSHRGALRQSSKSHPVLRQLPLLDRLQALKHPRLHHFTTAAARQCAQRSPLSWTGQRRQSP